MKKTIDTATKITIALMIISAAMLVYSMLTPKANAQEIRADTINVDKLLDCIAQVETGRVDKARGAAGERTRWQITHTVWKQHSKLPFNSSKPEAERIARAHIAWIRTNLARNGFPDWPYLIAVAWNGGMSVAYKADRPRRVEDYASRVTRLYVHSQ